VSDEGVEMEPEERLRAIIRDIAKRRNNVTLSEIESVMEKLSASYNVRRREARHGVLFGIDNHRFMVNSHNPGSKQVKSYSVDEFVNVMTELGWYEEDEHE
jgi:hypothetical protein